MCRPKTTKAHRSQRPQSSSLGAQPEQLVLNSTGLTLVISEMARTKQTPKRFIVKIRSVKKPRLFHPGTVALREIRKYLKSTDCSVIRMFPFQSLVREIGHEYKPGFHFQSHAIVTLRNAAEAHLVYLYSRTRKQAANSSKVAR